MKKLIIFFIIVLSLPLFAKSINIAVASNVSYAMPKIIEKFNTKHPDISVKVTYGGSGLLTAQITNKAPYELFLSANMLFPQKLYEKNLTLDKPAIYAKGALALFSKKNRDLSKGIFTLLDKEIDKIAIANPKLAPYGKAAQDTIKNAKLYDKIKSKIVYANNISQTLSYALSAADIGIVALSSLKSEKLKQFKIEKNYIKIDPKYYHPISQGVVIIKGTKNLKEAKSFYNFLFSKTAKEIFKEYGYQF